MEVGGVKPDFLLSHGCVRTLGRNLIMQTLITKFMLSDLLVNFPVIHGKEKK